MAIGADDVAPLMTLWRMLFVVIVALTVVAGGVLRLVAVNGDSMEPTVRNGQRVLIGRGWGEPAPGRLVVVADPQSGGLLLKRIVAVEGDRVRIQEGIVFRNGAAVPEPYAHHRDARWREDDNWPIQGSDADAVVPARTVFVLGDNRSQSQDSRAWGLVATANIVGVVLTKMP